MVAISEIHSHRSPRDRRVWDDYKPRSFSDVDALRKIGIVLDRKVARQMFAADAQQPTVTVPNASAPVQFLQNFLPGLVVINTEPRMIDSLVGLTTAASWDDEEIVQAIMEMTGEAVPYGDTTNIPYSNWNINYAIRTIVRFEMGMQVLNLEEARSAKQNVNSAEWKRKACAKMLEVIRNQVGMSGFNNGVNQTYGFLNEPSLPAYVTVANGALGSPSWSQKTYLEITADIRQALYGISQTSLGLIDVDRAMMTLALPIGYNTYMSVQSQFGNTVRDWLENNYKNLRIEYAPELLGAVGGQNGMYTYADVVEATTFNEASTDDNRTFDQYVPARYMVQGVEKLVKGTREGYLNATAGVLLKRPYAVFRSAGI